MVGNRSSDSNSSARTFLISVAAELAGMHAQTLRTYDRLGLVSPERSSGGGRRYSQHDVELLREVQRLSQDEGVNLAGIKRIIELTNQVEALQSRLVEMADELERLRRTPAPRRGGGAEEHRASGVAARRRPPQTPGRIARRPLRHLDGEAVTAAAQRKHSTSPNADRMAGVGGCRECAGGRSGRVCHCLVRFAEIPLTSYLPAPANTSAFLNRVPERCGPAASGP